MPLLDAPFIQAIQADYAALWLSNAGPNRQPDVVRLLAVRVEPDREHLTALVPLPQGQGVLDNLAVTPKLSFLFALILGTRSYQLKGTYVSHRPCTEAEVAFGRDYLTRFSQVLVGQGFAPEKAFAAYFSPSGVALTMRIEEMYEQTPRPGTGGKVTFDTP
jgi:hypothetical protein